MRSVLKEPGLAAGYAPGDAVVAVSRGRLNYLTRDEDYWFGPSHDDWRKTCLMESCRKTWHIPRTVE